MHRPLVISHRTHMGTMPENTLEGIYAALADGVDGIEIDVRATRDGVTVLMHDATLERTAGDPRAVSDLTLADLRDPRLRPRVETEVPPAIPTLAAALEAIAGQTTLVIEIKQTGIEHLVAADVRRAGAEEWCWVWAFDPAVAAASRAALPEVPASLNVARGSLARYGTDDDPVRLCVRLGLAAVSMEHRMVDAASVDRAHRRGLAAYTWTVDEPSDIARVVEAGVDAVCSNVPPVVRAALGPE